VITNTKFYKLRPSYSLYNSKIYIGDQYTERYIEKKMAEIEATREYDYEKDPAYQIGKDEKGYRMRVDANGRWIAIKDNEVVHSTFAITADEIICGVPEKSGKTKFMRQPNPEANPLEEVLGTEIQIYNNPQLKEIIGKSLFYTNSEGQQKPIPLATVLRECVINKLAKKNGKIPSMDEILGAVRDLRGGTQEEQAIY